MKRPNSSWIFSLSFLLAFGSHSESVFCQEKQDTVSKVLKEVTVVGDRQNLSGNSVKYYPSSKMKKASSNAIDLLQRMAINQIVINQITKEVTTLAKDNVAIFINGFPASKGDLDGLRSPDVKMVEFLDFPTDPIYRGERHVISIVTRKYEYGGYTKLYEDLEAVSHFANRFSIFSKFAYKNMAYDAYLGSSFSSSDHNGTFKKSEFYLADGMVTRNQDYVTGLSQQYGIPVSLRAIYDKPNKLQIANTLGFNFENRHKDYSRGLLSFFPASASEGNDYNTSNPSRGNSVSWTGGYYFIFPNSWSLYIIPSAAYSHNNNYSTYRNNGEWSQPIINNAKEDASQMMLHVNVYKTFNQSHSLNFNVKGNYYDSNSTHRQEWSLLLQNKP